MTGKQIVTNHYPQAWLRQTGAGGGGSLFEVRTGDEPDRVLATNRRRISAWADAARRVKAEVADRKWAEKRGLAEPSELA